MKTLWLKLVEVWHTIVANPAVVVALVWALYVSVQARRVSPDSQELIKQVLSVLCLMTFVILVDQWRRVQQLTKLGELAKNASAVRLFQTWDEADALLASAKETITILDTYYGESTHLAPLVKRALDAGARRLELNVYMLDPDRDYGAERLWEMSEANRSKSTEELRDEYRQSFQVSVSEIQRQLSAIPNVTVNVYTYPTMPEERQIIIDDSAFVVGWFPMSASNPAYSCIFVPAESFAPQDRAAVRRFREHLRAVQKVRLLAYTNKKETRKLRQAVTQMLPSPKGAT
jgi:hypothetical protein